MDPRIKSEEDGARGELSGKPSGWLNRIGRRTKPYQVTHAVEWLTQADRHRRIPSPPGELGGRQDNLLPPPILSPRKDRRLDPGVQEVVPLADDDDLHPGILPLDQVGRAALLALRRH